MPTAGLAGTIETLSRELAAVATAGDAWQEAIRALGHHPKSARLVLPLRNPVGKWIDLEPVLSPPPSHLQWVHETDLQEKLATQYRHLVARIAGCSPEATRTLSALAADIASFRVLLMPGDALDVTVRGVFIMAATINGLQLFAEWKRNPRHDRKDLRHLTRRVWWPLRLLDTYPADYRPGDLWLADLAARTIREGARSLTQNFQDKTAVQALGGVVLEFVTRSTLHKLLETEALGSVLLPHCRYELWPGFETIVAAEDAQSLRQVLITELVSQVAHHPAGSNGVALLRLLSQLPQLSPEHVWATRLFLSQLLWELLECDSQVLKKLLSAGKVATALLGAMRFLQNWRLDEPDPKHVALRNRLSDVIACLESYEQFRHLQALVKVAQSPAAASFPPAPSLST